MQHKSNKTLISQSKLTLLICLGLVLSALLVFWQVRNFDFVNYDDYAYVRDNPRVQSGLTGQNMTWAFTSCYLGYWQPLTWLSLMLVCDLFGPAPAGFHLANLFLHLANILLVFLVLRKMTGSFWAGAFVAAAFAIHPMHVESVAWISEHKDVLSAFFWWLTLAAYAGYVKQPSVGRYMTAFVLFALGLMAKPMLVTLPFVLLLLDYWPLNRFEVKMCGCSTSPNLSGRATLYKCIIEKFPFFFLAVVSGVVTFLTQRVGGMIVDSEMIPFKQRLVNASWSYMMYIGKFFWPQKLAIFYPFNAADISVAQFIGSVVVLIGVSILVIRLGRDRKYLLVGWFWFVGTLIPVIGLVGFTESAYGDRFTYIPYTGLFIMAAWGLSDYLERWQHRKVILGISAFIVLPGMAIIAHRQADVWTNSVTLFSHALKVTQNSYLANNNLGTALADMGDHQKALEYFEQAVKIKPGDPEANNNLGAAYYSLGRYQEAIESCQRAARMNPDYVKAYIDLGTAYGAAERYTEAVEAYQRAVTLHPQNARAHCNLGAAYFALGQLPESIEAFRQAIKIRPDYSQAHFSLGLAYMEAGKKEAAWEEYKILKTLDAKMADTLREMMNQ